MLRVLFLVLVVVCVLARPVELGNELHDNNPRWINPCLSAPLVSTSACNTSLSIDERVDTLLSLLITQDKVALLTTSSGAVNHLQIPSYQWWNEALHGVGRSRGVSFNDSAPFATSFPQVVTTSASFNKTLFHAIGDAIGTEARAFSNAGHAGLTFWAPNVNIFRDPRWGRGQETPGEDPVLTSAYAANFPLGLQDGPSWPKYAKVSACCKHFAAYSLENWGGVDRHHFDAVVSNQDLNDTYFPAFQTCVQKSSVTGFMCSFNSVNGVPACANNFLMTKTLRELWGFDGYITSDCGAVDDILTKHNYTETTDETCVQTLSNGMDIECGNFFAANLAHCIGIGKCSTEVTDTALRNLFKVQMRLGMFDPAEDQEYMKIGMVHVNSPQNQQLALDAARQGMVLLKNNNNRLPLSTQQISNAVVIGPNGNATTALLANYAGTPPFIISIVDGISAFATTQFFPGCNNISCLDTSGFADAVKAATTAEVVVMVLGLNVSIEGESHDRTSTNLPGNQSMLLSQVCQVVAAPIILVLIGGGSLDLTVPKSSDCVGAIVWAGYPGQFGGQAIAEVLFGVVNPSGRLTQTFYPESFVQQVSMFNMAMRPDPTSGYPGRTYRFYTGPTVYNFGYGLSFSSFEYHMVSEPELNGLTAAQVQRIADSVHNNLLLEPEPVGTFTISICNTAAIAGTEVVLMFMVPPNAGQNGAPLRQLARSFQRIPFEASECKNVRLAISPRDLVFAGSDGTMTCVSGEWTVAIGEPIQLQAKLTLL